jgi:hypothetical protein
MGDRYRMDVFPNAQEVNALAAWLPCLGCKQYMVRAYERWQPVVCPSCAAARRWSEADEAAYAELSAWFSAHYADPVEVCPFESAEGGYVYIWGGPYEALEALQAHWSAAFSEAF